MEVSRGKIGTFCIFTQGKYVIIIRYRGIFRRAYTVPAFSHSI
jgi:hypothetical protein